MKTSPTPSTRLWDWGSVVLLFLLMQVAAARLVVTGWTPYLYFTYTLSMLGVTLGLALGYSRFSPRLVRWLATLYSLVILPWRMTAAIEAEASFSERLALVGGRLWFSLGQFFARKPVEDWLMFVALVSLGFWIIGIVAGYALTRRDNPLPAIIPGGVAMLIIQIYDGYLAVRMWALAIYLFLALLYLGRVYLRQNRKVWETRRVFVTTESTQDFTRGALVMAALIVFVAWSLPTSIASVKGMGKAWDRFARPIQDRLSNAVTSLDSPYGTGGQGEFYSENLSIGRSAAIGDSPMFTVRVNTSLAEQPPRFYWQGRVYDSYSNGRWRNSDLQDHDFDPTADRLNLPPVQTPAQQVRFTFGIQLSQQALLYAPAGAFWINRPSRVYSTAAPGPSEDLSAWMADPYLSGGDKYQVDSWLTNPTIEELQAAGTEYPDWVTQRYMQEFPPGSPLAPFKQLALQVTQGKETPYDKAEAITDYLRYEIAYAPTVPAPPRGVDPVWWVVSEYKQGFCMYYASAEVLMLRAVGIPARMAVGFAQGIRDAKTGDYLVRRGDAHAWPEAYFPGMGWVEFEPTASQASLVRPAAPLGGSGASGEQSGLGLNGTGDRELDPNSRFSRLQEVDVPPAGQASNNGILTAGLVLLLAGALIASNQRFRLVERLPTYISRAYVRGGVHPPGWLRRWERWAQIGSIERSFHAVNFSLGWLGNAQPVHITPAERAAILSGMLPSAAPEIETLLEEHQRSIYTPRAGSASRARRAARKLVGLALWERIRAGWERLNRRFGRQFG